MKTQVVFLLLLLLFVSFVTQAKYIPDESKSTEEMMTFAVENEVLVDTIAQLQKIDSLDSEIYVPDSWDLGLDSLLNAWHIKYYVEKKENSGYREAVVGNDSIYVERLSKLNNIIELPYNEIIRDCINLYVDRRRSSVEYMLGLENFYFPMIEQALDENGLPDELKYLAVVESALNPVALSKAGASGLWQFMLVTGKQYNLEINSLVDERRDPLKATYAACEYFKDMYKIYGDWTLVIAAYNCGPGNVNKAIKRAKGSTDYWTIYPYLPRETRTYVPLFIAATYIMNYHAYHQLNPAQMILPTTTDTIMVDQTIHFDQISEVLNVEKEMLRALNPQYKKDIIPGHSKLRPIKLPALKTFEFITLHDSIINYKKEELFANRTYVGDKAPNQEKVVHRVVSGENLHIIGNKYGVTASEIRKWNGLKSSRVVAGKRLTIYVDNGGYASVDKASPSTTSTASIASTNSSKNRNEFTTYKVKSGESFYTIARKYPGYTHSDLMKINNTTSGRKLRVGQIIKVPKA